MASQLSCLEICAGAGGQSLGLELGGFTHELAVEIAPEACDTLRLNRPQWSVREGDIRELDGRLYRGVDLLAGGVPCPPFSVAGRQLGPADERDLFPEALRLVAEARPASVLLENVRGLSTKRFAPYRAAIQAQLARLGYESEWKLITSSDFGVPQLRPRFILYAARKRTFARFQWPDPSPKATTVGEVLYPLMARDGWPGAADWARRANSIGPTLVGGSKKHGGADLGPTRARAAWLKLGVDGGGIADAGPSRDSSHDHVPRLTLQMVAVLQGFPPEWSFCGRKTAAYRQIGNALPPPVAAALGRAIFSAMEGRTSASTLAEPRSA
ncbi:DNA cytosine methyltransferase [Mycolicibacterium novocastrense]|uniref:Cytosine-specific methyltransferase n=1 Tax=Mycolicibacterium novocastrense TaxID=59813 RepID=A0AAW5SRP7_MYCNV|nr:DNA cytosine methyltransferase [Mycolicibacterium novocastrense]MCV7026539.1 DNA cytosine methyltransferase [Mycolicibacterium novocastrense]GAT08465.1 DNA-cytosine methyltransferase [Mycolicibacterium novocastrense]